MIKSEKKSSSKIVFVGIIAIFLLIPLFFVNGIISDRAELYDETAKNIGKEWGGYQTIGGPVIVLEIPEIYRKSETEEEWKGARKYLILPEKLDIKTNLKTEIRKRGIYETSVYNTVVEISGNFKDIKSKIKKIGKIKNINAVVGVSDINSLVSVEEFEIDGEKIELDSGTGITQIEVLKTGISGKIAEKKLEKDNVNFKIKFELRGSEGISLLPFGEINKFEVDSTWKTPKFTGMLPADKKITNSGFNAKWDISYLTRSYKQEFYEDEISDDLTDGEANIVLYNKLTHYGKIQRATKYGTLFIFLTMGVVYIFEILSKRATHYIQYIIVGVSLTLFYLVLLSLAERISFEVSYLIAMLMVVVPNSLYLASITKKINYGIYMFIFLFIVYTMLFSILRMEEFALLTGTILVMIILYLAMYLTRNINEKSLESEHEKKN